MERGRVAVRLRISAAPPLATAGTRASPAARRLAAAHGVDLARPGGTGPEGAVTLAGTHAVDEPMAPSGRATGAAPARSPAAAMPASTR
ncbi:MAG: E3 binding domain-containing protein [Gemmatimonadaceae bacterium]